MKTQNTKNFTREKMATMERLLYYKQETKNGFDFFVERDNTIDRELCLKISFQYYANTMCIRGFYSKDIEAEYFQTMLGGEIFITSNGVRYSLDTMIECDKTFIIEIAAIN